MSRSFWMILGGALVILVAGFLIWFFGILSTSKEVATGPSPEASVTSPTPSPSVTASSQTSTTQTVKIYFIAIDDNGKLGTKIGCNDSAVPVNVEIASTQAVLRASIDKLLSIKDQHYGQSGLYNSLYNSNLKISSVSINNQKATIKLTGDLAVSGTCEGPRIKAQLEQTALQFSTVKSVEIFINGKNLTDILSEKSA